MVVRGRGRPAARSAKPAISSEVYTDPAAAAGAGADVPVLGDRPSRSPRASACESYRELIVEALGRGRNAMAIWQDLVDDHGFPAGYSSVRRFVSTLRDGPAADGGTVLPGEGEDAEDAADAGGAVVTVGLCRKRRFATQARIGSAVRS